ncbi:MAG: GNAT family N-acetyltransferase [Actinomycetota bacterium]
MNPTVRVVARTLDHPDVAPMIAQLNHELISTEPEGGTAHITLHPHEVSDGNGEFLVAYVDGAPRACGAYRGIAPGVAEVKRMWADPAMRHAGLGAAVLTAIETAATARGYDELRLETGLHLQAAVALYRKFGFVECAPWGDYINSPLSYCMTKSLT